MSDPRRTQQLATAHRHSSPDALTKPHVVARPSSDGVPRPIESPLRAPAPPPANSLTAALATTQFAQGSSEHVRPLMENDAAQTMQFTAAVTKPMAANALEHDDFAEHRAERTSTDLIAQSAAILQCVPQHAIYDSYEASISGGVTTLVPSSKSALLATAQKKAQVIAVPKSATPETAPKNAQVMTAAAPSNSTSTAAQLPSAKFVDDASTRLHAKQSPAAVATGVMRPNARVVFPAMHAAQLASGTTPPATTAAASSGLASTASPASAASSSPTPAPLPPAPAPGRVGTLPPEGRTAFGAAQPQITPQQTNAHVSTASHPSSLQGPASNPAARTVIEPQPILAAARRAFPLPAPNSASGPNAFAAGSIAPSNVATQFERPGAPSNAATQFERPGTPSNAATQFERPGTPRANNVVSLHDAKSRASLRDSSADVQRAVQAALDKRRAFIAESFRDVRSSSGMATGAHEEPTVLVAPLASARTNAGSPRGPVLTINAQRSYEDEAKTALLYMLLAVLTCVLAPVAWIHAEEQLMRSNALVFRIERAIGLALTLAAVAVIACGITVLAVR